LHPGENIGFSHVTGSPFTLRLSQRMTRI
jgi:hypothetical protein